VADRAPLTHVWKSDHADAAVAVARRAAEAIGIRDGATVTQLRIGPEGPRVLALSARTGGGHEAELCQAALGVDLNGLALSAALGEPISERRLQARCRVGGACVLFLTGSGEAQGLEEAEAAPGIEWARVYRGSDRAGAVLAVGESRDEALERATRAAEYVRFRAADAQALA
jgi:cysteine synthase A